MNLGIRPEYREGVNEGRRKVLRISERVHVGCERALFMSRSDLFGRMCDDRPPILGLEWPRTCALNYSAPWEVAASFSDSRVRYGMNGVTSKGIFSRSEMPRGGSLFSSCRLSFQGSNLTRPPKGKATISLAAGLSSTSAVTGTMARALSPSRGLIRLGISLDRCCN